MIFFKNFIANINLPKNSVKTRTADVGEVWRVKKTGKNADKLVF